MKGYLLVFMLLVCFICGCEGVKISDKTSIDKTPDGGKKEYGVIEHITGAAQLDTFKSTRKQLKDIGKEMEERNKIWEEE